VINTAQNILKTLGYFDLFHYPLTSEEIYLFHADNISPSAIDNTLEILVRDETIFKIDKFYTLQNDPVIVQKRCSGNLLAIKQMQIAVKVAGLLAKFPFTKGIAVSGSLSKNFANENSDIDFFIVTAPNRLWIARTFMHLYKKVTFLTGKQHWFCMNYYVDEIELEIPEKNIFTAIEIITLVPMQGKTSLANFMNSNKWTKTFFPVHSPTTGTNTPEIKVGIFRKLIERTLNGKAGNIIDRWLMNITNRRWQKKAEKKQLNNKGHNMGMVVGRHFSKPDPKNFQDKVVKRYEDRIKQIAQTQNKTVLPFL
jgi:predicted nucleotidyltransferase